MTGAVNEVTGGILARNGRGIDPTGGEDPVIIRQSDDAEPEPLLEVPLPDEELAGAASASNTP